MFTAEKMYHINYASRCCRTEKMVVFSSLLSLFYCAVPLAEGHRLPSFWWNANGVQRCVKTHKQHLQEWQPGIPSAPCSPSKVRPRLLSSAQAISPPSPSLLFPLLLPHRRTIFHRDCWLSTGPAHPAKWIHLTATELCRLQRWNTIVHYWSCLWSNLGA